MVCYEAPEPHIHVIWCAQFVTPSFAQSTLEDGKVLIFAGDIRLGLVPATLVVNPECLTLGEVNFPQAEDMDDLMARLAPVHPRLTLETPRPNRVSVTQASLSPLSLVHPRMVSPFLAPATAWNMMHTKANAMGMTQRVAPFLD